MMPQMDKAVLIDAYSQIFRSFYAIRALTDPQGRPVNALFVFTKLLLCIEKEHPCPTGAMLFDCGKVSFRLAVAPGYKANRPPMPDELRQQMPAIREMAAAFGWPLLSAENYEADDLIGGFARALPGEVLIVTSDKDLSQLVDDRISILVPAKGSAGGFALRRKEEVVEKFGVGPELVADYLALVGDTADNIPGVPGIGPKSAAALLNEYGPVEGWIDRLEKLDGSRFAAKLAGQERRLRDNLVLVRLKTTLPDEFADVPGTLARRPPDWEKIAALCREHAFNGILKTLPLPAAREPEPEEPAAAEEPDLFSALMSPVPEKSEKPAPPAEEEDLPIQGTLF
ncbi:MAG: hypothetical protein IJS01_04965 [Lentisphaeria bacterium]|nr:hypothetical protein [Lentisphaeria bacterium]